MEAVPKSRDVSAPNEPGVQLLGGVAATQVEKDFANEDLASALLTNWDQNLGLYGGRNGPRSRQKHANNEVPTDSRAPERVDGISRRVPVRKTLVRQRVAVAVTAWLPGKYPPQLGFPVPDADDKKFNSRLVAPIHLCDRTLSSAIIRLQNSSLAIWRAYRIAASTWRTIFENSSPSSAFQITDCLVVVRSGVMLF